MSFEAGRQGSNREPSTLEQRIMAADFDTTALKGWLEAIQQSHVGAELNKALSIVTTNTGALKIIQRVLEQGPEHKLSLEARRRIAEDVAQATGTSFHGLEDDLAPMLAEAGASQAEADEVLDWRFPRVQAAAALQGTELIMLRRQMIIPPRTQPLDPAYYELCYDVRLPGGNAQDIYFTIMDQAWLTHEPDSATASSKPDYVLAGREPLQLDTPPYTEPLQAMIYLAPESALWPRWP